MRFDPRKFLFNKSARSARFNLPSLDIDRWARPIRLPQQVSAPKPRMTDPFGHNEHQAITTRPTDREPLSGLPSDATPVSWRCVLSAFGLLFLLFSACAPKADIDFVPNRLLTWRMERELESDLSVIAIDIATTLERVFGTPDKPMRPRILDSTLATAKLLRQDYLDRAAGPVGRGFDDVETGLFRKHCSQCHGITGDGRGPAAALLDPYPRDFRRGTFKVKSTPPNSRPSIDDLIHVLENGIVGTSMPAMRNLKSDRHYANDIDVLAEYVRYLAIRGEVEREIMMRLVPDLDLDVRTSIVRTNDDGSPNAEDLKAIDDVIMKVAMRWTAADTISIPEPSMSFDIAKRDEWSDEQKESFLEAARHGRELFQSNTAACYQCHGEKGDGQGKLVDFDEWTKDWTTRAGIDPREREQWQPLKKLGLLKPVPARPRNLEWGVFRRGSDSSSIYRTIVSGIEGSPMPAASLQPTVTSGLSTDDVWDLVYFCQALSLPEFKEQIFAPEVAAQ